MGSQLYVKKFLLISGILLATQQPVSARGFLSEVGDFFFDPLKLRASSENVHRSVNTAVAALADLQARTDTSVKGWLEDVSRIVTDANSGVAARISQAEKAAFALEKQIVADMSALLQDVECAGERFANEVVQRSLINAINTLKAANVSVELPLIGPTEIINIESPPDIENDQLYRAYKQSKLSHLEDALEADPGNVDPNEIISAYQNISERAFAVHCHYARSGGDVRFLADHYEFRSKLSPWTEGVFRVPL